MKHRLFIAAITCAVICVAINGRVWAQDAMSSVDNLLADGWNDYSEELDFEAALEAYEAVTQHPDASDVQLVEAFEYLAACHFALGNQGGAREALTNLLTINYDQELSDPSHSPDFLQMIEDLRAEMPPPPPDGSAETGPGEEELPPAFGSTDGAIGEGDGQGSIDDDGGRRDRRPFYRTWWFWTITGVVVVGALTAGIVAGTSSGGVADPPQGSLDPGVVQLPCVIRF